MAGGDTIQVSGVNDCCDTGDAGTATQGGNLNAGDATMRQLSFWRPTLNNPDEDIKAAKPLTEARTTNFLGNSGFAAGAVDSSRDRIVGHRYKLILRPAYRQLGIDYKAATEWAEMVAPIFQAYFDDPECYIDAARRRNGVELLRAAVASEMLHGEALVTREYRDDNPTFGTCFQLIGPPRLSTPPDVDAVGNRIVMGVELGEKYGDPLAYHIKGLKEDGMSPQWSRIPRVNAEGVQNVYHVFETARPDHQTRGLSRFASVLMKAKQMDRYEDAELEAAVLGASYALTVESPFGPAAAFDAIGGDFTKTLGEYIKAQTGYNKAAPLTYNGQKVTHMFPGEKLIMNRAEHPNSGFPEFESAMLRHVARALGLTYEQVSGDYSKVNYSSARAAMAEAWQYVLGKRAAVPNRIGTLMVRAWLDEAVALGIVPLPPGVTDYRRARQFLTVCEWIGAGRPIVDEVKSAKANQTRLENGETNLSKLCAEQGDDWQQVMEQRFAEEAHRRALQEKYGFDIMSNIVKETDTDSEPEDEQDDADEQDGADEQDDGQQAPENDDQTANAIE